jgi:hypothetical protein
MTVRTEEAFSARCLDPILKRCNKGSTVRFTALLGELFSVTRRLPVHQ